MIVTGQTERVSKWVGERIGNCTWYGHEAIGLERDGQLIAGVVVDSYVPNARCSIHCAGDGKRWLNRPFLHYVFSYVFEYMNCRVVVNPVNSTNTDSARFTAHLGFDLACTIPNGWGASDLLIFTLHKENCRWLAQKG